MIDLLVFRNAKQFLILINDFLILLNDFLILINHFSISTNYTFIDTKKWFLKTINKWFLNIYKWFRNNNKHLLISSINRCSFCPLWPSDFSLRSWTSIDWRPVALHLSITWCGRNRHQSKQDGGSVTRSSVRAVLLFCFDF